MIESSIDPDVYQVTCLEQIRCTKNRTRQVFHVTDGQHELLLKRERYHSIKHSIRATIKTAALVNEYQMLKHAMQAGLPVPEPHKLQTIRRLGLVVEHSLFAQWFSNRVLLRDLAIESRDSGQLDVLDQAITCLCMMTARIRRAALADCDFGMHNLLVHPAADTFEQPIWIDLEATWQCHPNNPHGTAKTVGVTLSNCWVMSGGRQEKLEMTFRLLLDQLPEPSGGWRTCMKKINLVLFQRIKRAMRVERTNRLPQPLKV